MPRCATGWLQPERSYADVGDFDEEVEEATKNAKHHSPSATESISVVALADEMVAKYSPDHLFGPEMRGVQRIDDQDIPAPMDDTVHEVLNIKAFGYDCTKVEHFAQYTHNLVKNMGLQIFDCYPLPAQSTLIQAIQGAGLKEKDKLKDYTLETYQRVIQIQDLPSKRASLLLDLLQLSLPEGVSFSVEPHTQEHFKERHIKKEIPESML